MSNSCLNLSPASPELDMPEFLYEIQNELEEWKQCDPYANILFHPSLIKYGQEANKTELAYLVNFVKEHFHEQRGMTGFSEALLNEFKRAQKSPIGILRGKKIDSTTILSTELNLFVFRDNLRNLLSPFIIDILYSKNKKPNYVVKYPFLSSFLQNLTELEHNHQFKNVGITPQSEPLWFYENIDIDLDTLLNGIEGLEDYYKEPYLYNLSVSISRINKKIDYFYEATWSDYLFARLLGKTYTMTMEGEQKPLLAYGRLVRKDIIEEKSHQFYFGK